MNTTPVIFYQGREVSIINKRFLKQVQAKLQ